jgi:flavorubredoxin
MPSAKSKSWLGIQTHNQCGRAQVTTALGAILRASEAKALPCGVFGSFGWSGEAVDEMEARLRDAGFKFGFEPIRVKFKPTAGQLQVGPFLFPFRCAVP